jgi:hypothetical protein
MAVIVMRFEQNMQHSLNHHLGIGPELVLGLS